MNRFTLAQLMEIGYDVTGQLDGIEIVTEKVLLVDDSTGSVRAIDFKQVGNRTYFDTPVVIKADSCQGIEMHYALIVPKEEPMPAGTKEKYTCHDKTYGKNFRRHNKGKRK